ncbi:MAG TPA: retroviral-like aspartic protease family protein [Acetobacteraceae bacterium]|jgi:predicted aspartyl protease
MLHPTIARATAFALLMLAAVVGTAHAACTVQARGSVTFALIANRVIVPLTVNGINAAFVLDTGAERTLVTPEAVQRLGLASDKWVGTTMSGVGGIVEHPNADPRSLSLGGVKLHRRTVSHDTSLTVGAMPGLAPDGMVLDGLLGRDFLSAFDLQLDMPAHRLTVFDVSGCSGRFLPWAGPYAALSAEMPMTQAMVVPIAVDGQPLRALLDTGATSSLIVAPGMFRLGLTPALLARDPGATMTGIGPQSPAMHRHRFASLRIGPEVQRDPWLWVASVHVVPIVDALLGEDWVAAQRRVWISFATGQVFFER